MGGGPCTAVAIDGGILLISDNKTFEYRNAEWSEVSFDDARCHAGGQAYGFLTLG